MRDPGKEVVYGHGSVLRTIHRVPKNSINILLINMQLCTQISKGLRK